jgi:hypothetical protein
MGICITKNTKNAKKLKNIHAGKRVFLVGNGPSLTPEDLNLIKEEFSIAANKIYLIFEQAEWRPTYYFVQDPSIIKYNKSEIESQVHCPIFAPNRIVRLNADIKNSHSFYLFSDDIKNNRKLRFGKDPVTGFHDSYTVMYSMIQFAFYAGFKEIYLLGVDFDYGQSADDKSQTQNKKNHFHENYIKKGEVIGPPDMDLSLQGYVKAKEEALNVGINIYNSTRGGRLELFERKNLDEIISNKIHS